jgi:mono/diheme cytochrome c family protein
MKNSRKLGTAIVVLACFMAAASVSAADKAKDDPGKREYVSKCAACHGLGAKGDGPARAVLKAAPTDLTVLAKKNGGVFPVDRIYAVIDGREAVASHGTREMPIWGQELSDAMAEFSQYYSGGREEREGYIRARILALIDYLNRLQAK